MRQSRENQLPLTPLWPDHQHAQELREISKILDENSKLNELVWQDLSEADSTKGAPGDERGAGVALWCDQTDASVLL